LKNNQKSEFVCRKSYFGNREKEVAAGKKKSQQGGKNEEAPVFPYKEWAGACCFFTVR